MYRMYVCTFMYVRTIYVRLFIIFQKVVVLYGTFEDVRACGLFGMLIGKKPRSISSGIFGF